jgi:plastocyanin
MARSRRLLQPGRRLLAVSILAMALVTVGCGSSKSANGGGGGVYGGGSTPTPTASGSGNAVTIVNFAFNPQKITVKTGAKVTWTNQDGVQHTVTSADGISTSANKTSLFDSGNLSQGQTFSYTFTKAGTYLLRVHHPRDAGGHAR